MIMKTEYYAPAVPNAPLDPREVFKHAMQFTNVDNFLRQITTSDAFGYFNLAAIVINTFAIELFLKCIVVIDNPTFTKKSLKAHDLLELFNKVSPNRRKEIIDLWNKSPAIHEIANAARAGVTASGGDPFSTDLPTAIRHCKDAFQEILYLYEGAGASAFYIWRLTEFFMTASPQFTRNGLRRILLFLLRLIYRKPNRRRSTHSDISRRSSPVASRFCFLAPY